MAEESQAIVDLKVATTRQSPVSFRKNVLTARKRVAASVEPDG
jgi:hypothetical protein